MAPADEAAALLACVARADAVAGLDELVARRLTGEPLAWITGTTTFAGLVLQVHPGVYVPRPHSELVARRAAELLPAGGIGVDVCTGAGPVAAVMAAHRPDAQVVATDTDERAVACARANGVDARVGDLFAGLPDLAGRVDVVAGVVPYVPTAALRLLQRDALAFESVGSFDGGADGLAVLRRVVAEARRWLRPGGTVVLELGGDEAAALQPDLVHAGFGEVRTLVDDDGDVRGVEARWGVSPRAATRTG